VTIVELVSDVDDWLAWARRNDIHPFVRAYVRFKGASALHDFQASNDMTNSPSPRTVKHASDIVKISREVSDPLLRVLLSGATGTGWATEFMSFRQVFSKLPKLAAIVSAPKKAPVPSDESAKFAIIEGLLDKVSGTYIDPFMEYILRFPKEFQAWFYEQIKDMHPELVRTQAMTTWASKNGVSITSPLAHAGGDNDAICTHHTITFYRGI